MNTKGQLDKLGIIPDPLKDQFFLTDEEIMVKIVASADLHKNDVVLEVGAGVGNLTNELAKKAGRVIAFEIDPRFKPILAKLPKNVEVHFENAWKFVQLHGKFKHKKEYNKVVANLPYSFVEPFLHNLTFLDYDKVILAVPIKFLKKINGWGVFGSFFKATVLLEIPKEKFYPVPRTDSIVIEFIKLPDPLENKNPGLFLRQYLYQHEQQLVKNSLMAGIIKYTRLARSKSLTKNQAREIVAKSGIDKDLLEKYPDNPMVYEEVEKRFNKLL